jgi:beta-hydroxylase
VAQERQTHGFAGARGGVRRRTAERPSQNLLVRFGKALRRPVNAWLARQSAIGDDPIVDARHVPALMALQPHWETIRGELLKLLADGGEVPSLGSISPDHRRIAPPPWKSFFFEGYGFRSQANCARCPRTAELLDRVPGLVVAFFSILEPGTHIPRHRGLTKAWLNCHLPLLVPRAPGRCEIEIADARRRWREGEWLVFDETNRHEVWNLTGEPRVVLFLQVRRPMRLPGRLASKLIYHGVRVSSFAQDARRAIGAKPVRPRW